MGNCHSLIIQFLKIWQNCIHYTLLCHYVLVLEFDFEFHGYKDKFIFNGNTTSSSDLNYYGFKMNNSFLYTVLLFLDLLCNTISLSDLNIWSCTLILIFVFSTTSAESSFDSPFENFSSCFSGAGFGDGGPNEVNQFD